MGVCFVLLANSTSLDILADKGSKSRPPELCCDKLPGFQYTGVAGRGVVMVFLNSGAMQLKLFWDIDPILV